MIERDKEFAKAIDEIAKGIEATIKQEKGQSLTLTRKRNKNS